MRYLPICIILLGGCASISPDENASVGPYTQAGRGFSLNASAGFTVSPETPLLSGEALWRFGAPVGGPGRVPGHFEGGGLLQMGFTGKNQIFAPAGVVRFVFDLERQPRLRPFGEGGLGFLVSHRKGHTTRGSGLIVIGGGVEYMIRDRIGVGGKGYLNFAPGPGEDFFGSLMGGVTWYY